MIIILGKLKLLRGELPKGLEFESQENMGLIHGIPLETGKFEITIMAHSEKLAADIQSSDDRSEDGVA